MMAEKQPVREETVAPSGADLKTLLAPQMQDLPGGAVPSGAQLKAMTAPSMLRQFLGGVNVAIAETLDLPGNALAELLGMAGIDVEAGGNRMLFDEAGLTPPRGQEPETRAFASGHMVGMTAPLIAAAPAGATVRSGGIAAGVLRQVGETAVRRPMTTTGLELTSAATAGVGMFEARRRFPDSPAAEMISGILGGLAPAGAVMAPLLAGQATMAVARRTPVIGMAVRGGSAILRRAREQFTPSGAMRRAAGRVERAVEEPVTALRRLEEPGVLPEAELTPAQRTREPGLLALERSIIETSDTAAFESDRQIAGLNRTITDALSAPDDAVETTRRAFESAQVYLLRLLDGRLRIAALEADRRIGALAPGTAAREANEIARNEIDQALVVARATERQLYAVLPAELSTPPTVARQTLAEELISRGRTADPEDIPDFVTQFLGELNKKGEMTGGSLRKGATFDELRVLRGRILEEIRAERAAAAPKRNKIRMLDDLQEALLADLGVAEGEVIGQAGMDLRIALDFSRNLNDRFTRGTVGRLLGATKRGGPAVAPALTLEATIGTRGAKAAQNAREIIAAVKEGPEELLGAMGDFIKGRFLKQTIKNGQINSDKARQFLVDHEELLNEFPALRSEITSAIDADDVGRIAQRRGQSVAARLGNPRISKATLFIKSEPRRAFQAIRETRNPGREIQNLINLAGRDATGEATEGLRSAFVDWLLSRATVAATDVAGQQFVSGARLRIAMQDGPTMAIAERLLTTEQKRRLDQALETALTLDAARAARPAREGVIADAPSILMEILGRIGGAQLGRVIAGRTGGGTVQTPGIISNRMRALLRNRVKDPAARLLNDAILSDDPELLKALLTRLDTPEAQKFVTSRINAWLAVVLFGAGAPPQGQSQDPNPRFPALP